MSLSVPLSLPDSRVDPHRVRYPHSVVWTPLPMITWCCPCIGHMGIAYTNGVIRDFAGSYYVSEDSMAFGNPTRYVQLDVSRVPLSQEAEHGPSNASNGKSRTYLVDTHQEKIGPEPPVGVSNGDAGPPIQSESELLRQRSELFNRAVYEASAEYKHHMHNLCCDNCHSHVALALNNMHYDRRSDWNMVKLAALIFLRGRHVGVGGLLKTWLPFLILLSIFIATIIFFYLI